MSEKIQLSDKDATFDIKDTTSDLISRQFGRLTVIDFEGIHTTPCGTRRKMWRCRCECGNEVIRATSELRKRSNHSCGCLATEHLADMSKKNVTHGMTGTRLYGCYKGMMSRCYRKKDIHYNAYGKRGITVCAEWKNNPDAFIKWANENGYSDDLTIDRINVNGNYEPSNCRWIPMSEQYKNKQSNSGKTPLPEPYKEEGKKK